MNIYIIMLSTPVLLIMNVQVLLPLFVLLSVNFRPASTDVCGQTYFDAASGTISSPNYPVEYPSSLNCTYTISVSGGSSVYIRFVEFITEEKYDHLTISCANGVAFERRVLTGQRYSSTLLIGSCRLAILSFVSDNTIQGAGFSFIYSSVQAQTMSEGFRVRPSNIFLQTAASNILRPTFNCTSTSGFLPWWMYHPKDQEYNKTVTNGYCNVTFNYKSHFISESFGPGSCNLIVGVSPFNISQYQGAFVCNYGTSTSAGAFLVPVDPGFQFSKGFGRAVETLKALDPTADDMVQYSCSPALKTFPAGELRQMWNFNFSGQHSSIAQIRILRVYWTDDTGRVISNTTSDLSSIVVKPQAVSGVYVFPSYMCNIGFQFSTSVSFMDTSTLVAFGTGTARIPFGPDKETISIIGDDGGEIIRGGILSCYAHAYPAATYHWTDESTGQLVNGPAITVTHSGQYTCTASNDFNQILHQESKTITIEVFDVDKSERLNEKTIILVVVVGVVILAINVAVTVLFHHFKKNSTANDQSLEYTRKKQNDYGLSGKEQPGHLYANDIQCQRMSRRSSHESDIIYEDV